MELLQFTSFFHHYFVDPAQMFGYVNIDVGDIWVVTVFVPVE